MIKKSVVAALVAMPVIAIATGTATAASPSQLKGDVHGYAKHHVSASNDHKKHGMNYHYGDYFDYDDYGEYGYYDSEIHHNMTAKEFFKEQSKNSS